MRVWTAFLRLNEKGHFTADDASRKVYHTFCTSLKKTNPLLVSELRSQYGLPGTSSPSLNEVLRRVKEVEEAPPATKLQVHASHGPPSSVASESQIDYDQLADKVAERLRAKRYPQQRSRPFRPRGPCFNCGVLNDRIKAHCPNPANPAKVAAETEKLRALNAVQSLTTGDRRLRRPLTTPESTLTRTQPHDHCLQPPSDQYSEIVFPLRPI